MSYHPRIESKDYSSLVTTRSRNSELWFINNKALEEAILGYLAKYQTRYDVTLYAAAVEGNHMHELALFTHANRADFTRDLNSSVARAVTRHSPGYSGGRFWARRYSSEFVPEANDVEDKFFYLALQPVQDGLVDRISDYPGYNFFNDAINGRSRRFKVVNWGAYNDALRWKKNVKIKDYTETVELRFARLPGYEHLSQKEYKALMLQKLEERRLEILRKRGTPSLGRERLTTMKQGACPRSTKTATRFSHRPRILCSCPVQRRHYLSWYFDIYFRFRKASQLYRSGDSGIEFPPGTFKPPLFTVHALKANH